MRNNFLKIFTLYFRQCLKRPIVAHSGGEIAHNYKFCWFLDFSHLFLPCLVFFGYSGDSKKLFLWTQKLLRGAPVKKRAPYNMLTSLITFFKRSPKPLWTNPSTMFFGVLKRISFATQPHIFFFGGNWRYLLFFWGMVFGRYRVSF